MSEVSTSIAAILIDPNTRTVTAIRVPIVPPHEDEAEWCVNDIPIDELYRLLSCHIFGSFPMPGQHADICYYVDDYLDADNKHVSFFQLRDDWEPISGRCLIVGFDMERHEYRDTATTVTDIQNKVIWTRRIVRGYSTEAIEGGVRITRTAPIIDETQ